MYGGEYKIPYSESKTGSGDANNDGIKEWYYYKVMDMTEYLNNTYGHYIEVSINDIQGQKGIIGLSDCGWNNSTGHLDVWDGSNCINQMYTECKTVYFWKMK